VFEPDIEENSSGGLTVRNVLKGWINDFFFIAKMITRLDTTQQSDFLLEIRSCFEVRECLALINANLDKVETECADFKKQFDVYSYLWQQNPQQQFEKFLDENEPKDAGNPGE